MKPGSSGNVVELTGTVGFDEIEGGCAYLATADGTYQVIYPAGWQVDRATGALTGPDGQSVLPGGHITVRGFIADLMLTCQIGPIFQATEVIASGN